MKLVNNARSILKTDIVGGSSSFLVQDLEGDVFKYEVDGGTTNEFTIFAEQIENSVITRREPIKVKRVGDVFTIITRKSQFCVGNDTVSPKIREQKEYNFTAGITQISIYASEEDFDYIENELALKLSTSTYDSEKIQQGNSTTGNDSYQANISTVTSYVAGQRFQILCDVSNTTSATLEINSLGAINIQVGEGGSLIDIPSDTITAGTYAFFTYLSSGIFQYTGNEGNIIATDVSNTKSNVSGAEDIAIGKAIVYETGVGFVKGDASDSAKLNFVGFSDDTITSGNPLIMNTSGVDNNQSGLTIGSDYYLDDAYEEESDPVAGVISQLGGAYSSSYVSSASRGWGQSFSTTNDGKVNSVEFYFPSVQSTYTCYAEVKLYTVSGDLPSVLIGTTPEEFINAEGFKTFTFPTPIDITHGDKYVAVVLWKSGSRLYTPYRNGGSSYLGGTGIANTSGSWYDTGDDMKFKINTTQYTYTPISGDISTTPGTNSIKVGKAISTTELLINSGAF